MTFVSRLWRRGPVCGKRERRGEWRERPAEAGGSGSLARGAPPARHVWAPPRDRGGAGPARGALCAAVHALRPLGCRPAPRRAGLSPTEAPTLPPSPPRKGRPAGRSAERRGQVRGEGALGPPQPGSWPLQPRPLRGKKKIIRRRRSEFPGCSHSETQAGKLADAWPVPRETRRAPARLFRKVRAPPAGRAGRVPGPRRRAPPRRSSLSGPCPHRQLPGVRRNPFGQNWLGVPI